MLHLVLHEPEIPPNTGNLMRLAANTGVTLHLVHPLGFALEDKLLQRAGLDYQEWASVQQHASWVAFCKTMPGARVWAFTTRAQRFYSDASFADGDVLLFGAETRGLPQALLDGLPKTQWLRLPMQPHSRSLNLANAASVAVYEAWRQLGFGGASTT